MVKQTDQFQNIKNQNGFVFSGILIVAALVVIAALIGSYELGRRQAPSSKAPSVKNSPSTPVVKGPKTTATSGTLNIKEFGVSVPLSADLNGLSYVAESNPQKTITLISVKLDSFTAVADKCVGLPGSAPQTFASLVKTKGQYDPQKDPNATLLKQFGDFYISNVGGSQPPKVTCKDSSVQAQYDSVSSQLNGALQASFANAKATA